MNQAACVVVPLIALLAGGAAADGEPHPDQTTETRTLGPFSIGALPARVTAEVVRVGTRSYGEWLTTDARLTVRGEAAEVLLEREYPQAYFSTYLVLDTLDLPGLGPALLVMRDTETAAPGTGLSCQVFGRRKDGRIVPMTGVIVPHFNGEALSSQFRVVSGRGAKPDALAIEVEEWTGSFLVLRHYPIDPGGVSGDEPIAEVEVRYQVLIDPKDAAADRVELAKRPEVTRLEPGEQPYLVLRGEPRSEAAGVRVLVSPSSTVEFLDAALTNGDWFLRVRIDGHEGYVPVDDQDDMNRLGFPSAG